VVLLFAQASLKQRFDKAKYMKISCDWWRFVWRSCFNCIKFV